MEKRLGLINAITTVLLAGALVWFAYSLSHREIESTCQVFIRVTEWNAGNKIVFMEGPYLSYEFAVEQSKHITTFADSIHVEIIEDCAK